MIRLIASLALLAGPVAADTLIAARTIPAQAVIGPADIALRGETTPGALSDPVLAVGMEARVALYAGRPIRPGDLGPPAVVERNQLVTLIYEGNGLAISTEGRALGRAGPGDVIQVMNLSSRMTVTAQIAADGTAHVSR